MFARWESMAPRILEGLLSTEFQLQQKRGSVPSQSRWRLRRPRRCLPFCLRQVASCWQSCSPKSRWSRAHWNMRSEHCSCAVHANTWRVIKKQTMQPIYDSIKAYTQLCRRTTTGSASGALHRRRPLSCVRLVAVRAARPNAQDPHRHPDREPAAPHTLAPHTLPRRSLAIPLRAANRSVVAANAATHVPA